MSAEIQNLVPTEVTPTSVKLTWAVSTTSYLQGILVVTRAGTSVLDRKQLQATARMTTVGALTPGAKYSFDVYALDELGGKHAEATTAPEAHKEEPPPSKGAGHVNIRYDARSAADSVPTAWFKKLARVMGYPPAGDRFPQAGIQTLAYHDAWTNWRAQGATHVAEYVALVARDKQAGYAGQFMDDINFQGGNIAGTRKQLADLVEAVRSALGPTGVLEINCQYVDVWPLIKASDPDVLRALAKADVVTKEFNVDPTSGINTAQRFREFIEYVDYLHGRGIHTTMSGDGQHNTPADMEYSLATYLLNNDGKDFVGFSGLAPGNEWPGAFVDLGEATSSRQRDSNGVWHRTFEHGVAYVVEPGASTATVTLSEPKRTLGGTTVSQITLAASNGAVLTS